MPRPRAQGFGVFDSVAMIIELNENLKDEYCIFLFASLVCNAIGDFVCVYWFMSQKTGQFSVETIYI